MTYQDSTNHVFYDHTRHGHGWKYWEGLFAKRKDADIRQSIEEYAQLKIPRVKKPLKNTDIEL